MRWSSSSRGRLALALRTPTTGATPEHRGSSSATTWERLGPTLELADRLRQRRSGQVIGLIIPQEMEPLGDLSLAPSWPLTGLLFSDAHSLHHVSGCNRSGCSINSCHRRTSSGRRSRTRRRRAAVAAGPGLSCIDARLFSGALPCTASRRFGALRAGPAVVFGELRRCR